MTSIYGPKSTLTAKEKDLHINIEDLVLKYPSPRIELVKRWNNPKVFRKPIRSHKYEWSTRDNRGVKTTITDDVPTDATSMQVVDAGVFNKDDVFMTSDGRKFRVTSVSGGTLVNFHPVDSSKPMQAQTAGAAVVVIGVAAAQGADADNMVIKGFEDLYNNTQIFEDVVELTGTQHASLIRGDENSTQLIARKHQELLEKLNYTLVLGDRYKDDARGVTYMGGIKYFIENYAPDNVVDFGGSATWSSDADVIGKIDDALDKISNKVFDKPVMLVGSKFMRKFKFVQDSIQRTTVGEKKRGIGVVDTYLSHLYGNIDVVLIQDRIGALDDAVYFVDESQLGYKALRKWRTYPLARNGDKFRWQVLGEYTFKLNIPESAAMLHNLGV